MFRGSIFYKKKGLFLPGIYFCLIRDIFRCHNRHQEENYHQINCLQTEINEWNQMRKRGA